jgi:hypothetical protein
MVIYQNRVFDILITARSKYDTRMGVFGGGARVLIPAETLGKDA